MLQYCSLLLLTWIMIAAAQNLNFLDPTKLQTQTSSMVQQQAATKLIQKYSKQVIVKVNPLLFSDKKDMFALRTTNGQLHINASTGVAAVWGFNYYLKKYCRSHIGWQVKRISIPDPLPEVDETVVASDRFRYYQNTCTFSYSFVWWDLRKWDEHVDWMALNGINLVLAPIDEEAIWAKVYKTIGMTDEEIAQYFAGPAFLSWLRMGNMHGWGGPLLKSWHHGQSLIQAYVVQRMFTLGMIPIFPAFNGHIPNAISRIYPNITVDKCQNWNNFSPKYCCGLFLDPSEPLFKTIGTMFLIELTSLLPTSHIFNADPFIEISVSGMPVELIKSTFKAIFSSIAEVDKSGVLLIQNWMFANDPSDWPEEKSKAVLLSVPIGRLLVLDMWSEHRPQYDRYKMYFGQPFIWSMLHNFGGTSGMIGKMPTINKNVHEVRSRINSTMIGIGLTMEGINQNYVVYDLMLEAGWRNRPVENLNEWVEEYAARRYGCNDTAFAWRQLLQSVYSYNSQARYGYNQYIIIKTPSFSYNSWTWYNFGNLLNAFKTLSSAPRRCDSTGFYHDLVDVTRQVLQVRAEQLYVQRVIKKSTVSVFNASIHQYLDALYDMEQILASNDDFTAVDWLGRASSFADNAAELELYNLNARNQITLWGPNGEITNYAAKQWAELFHYYYIPRWTMFLNAALEAKVKNVTFDEHTEQVIIRKNIEIPFAKIKIENLPKQNTRKLARALYKKWKKLPPIRNPLD